MKAKMILACLACLLSAAAALAEQSKAKGAVARSGSSYVVTTGEPGEPGDDGVRVILNGTGDVKVVTVGSSGEKGSKTLRMHSSDGRVTFETEPDPEQPWLGVLLSFKADGVEIDSVMDDSPADRAGLQVGDLIIKADGRDMSEGEQRGGLLEGKGPGDSVRFTVLREGKEQQLRVELGSHPGRVEFELDEERGAFGMAGNLLGSLGSLEGLQSLRSLESLKGLGMLSFLDCDDDDAPCAPTILNLAGHSKPRLGVVLESLSPQLAEFFEVKAGEGMLVKDVLEGSLAERSGLKAGDVLVQIDDTKINSLADVRDSLKEVRKGQSVRVEVVRRGVRESFRAELDTDPNSASGMSFSLGSGATPRNEGDQGSLESIEQAHEPARDARVSRDADDHAAAAEHARAAAEAKRRSLEKALAEARVRDESGEAKRTF